MIGSSPVGSTPVGSKGRTSSTSTPPTNPLPVGSVVNERDVLLQSSGRLVGSPSTAVIPTPSASNFFVQEDESHTPDYIRIGLTTISCVGPFTFRAQGATLSNVTAKTADVKFEDMDSLTAIITITADNNGLPIEGSCIIGKLTNGSIGGVGPDGPRGAGHFNIYGEQWDDTLADMAVPLPKQVNDVVTITNKTTYALTKTWDGKSWIVTGAIYDGSLFVTRSIYAAALNVQTLDSVAGTIGTFTTGGAGARTDISDYGVKVYGDNAGLRVTLGKYGT